jgi:hypothetical protein
MIGACVSAAVLGLIENSFTQPTCGTRTGAEK